MTFISQKFGQFNYFSLQLGESNWSGKEVLDFGGNIGNILRDANCTIDEERYSCIDVSAEAIETGQRDFPKAHWELYDRYCFFFNPNGTPNLKLPPTSRQFDYVIAYSVFTNTLRSDMLDLVEDLRTFLKPGGALAFTFIDPHYRSWPGEYHGDNLLWRLERDQSLYPDVEINIREITQKASGAQWFILVNATDLYLETDDIPSYAPHNQRTCHTFYSEQYMRSLFPDARVLPPAGNEMQHCCIING